MVSLGLYIKHYKDFFFKSSGVRHDKEYKSIKKIICFVKREEKGQEAIRKSNKDGKPNSQESPVAHPKLGSSQKAALR